MQIRVSVVVPAYNREKYIERCIRSIMAQTVTPFEILVVDDGSTDGTVKISDSIECGYLKIIRQNHKGAQAARNLGILNASGEYIAFLDSDDEWMPEMLERNIAHLLKEKRDCALYTDCYTCENNKKRVWSLPGYTGNLYDYLLLAQAPTFSGLFAKKEVLIKMGLLDENVVSYQEWDTSIRLAKEVKFIHIKEPLFIYHLHNDEAMRKEWDKGIKGYAYIVRKYRQDILKRHGHNGLKVHYKFLIQECSRHKNKLFIVFWGQYFYSNILSKVNELKKWGEG